MKKTTKADVSNKTCRPVSIAGTGFYVPERVLTNADLEKMVDTSNEWIISRSGIKERHIAADSEATSDLCTKAALRAMASAGIQPEDIDLIIVGTSTPDMPSPQYRVPGSTEYRRSQRGRFFHGSACSSFLFAMETGRHYVASGAKNTVLVIGADKLSSFVDWEDRATCVLFGDGAGAVVLKSDETKRGIISCVMGSDGRLSHLQSATYGSRLLTSEKT